MQVSEMSESTQLVVQAFRDMVNEAFSDASSSEWHVDVTGEARPENVNLTSTAGFRFTFQGAASGDVIFGVYYDMLPRLGYRDLSDDTPDLGTVQKARLVTAFEGRIPKLEQALSGAGTVKIQVELVENPALGDQQVFELACRQRSNGEESTFAMHLCISPKLIAELQPSAAKPFVFPQAGEGAGNLDLVMDVELNVTLRFGQKQLALREVLELASGSVVELDRQVDEPIELILDGKVVARGEAVIIDGNYGMRVTQVLQPFVA